MTDADENNQCCSRHYAFHLADSVRESSHGRVGRDSYPLKKEILKRISDSGPKAAEPPGKQGESGLASR
jgi:hypothetical protein